MHLPLSMSSRVKAFPNSSREALGSATTITILSPATIASDLFWGIVLDRGDPGSVGAGRAKLRLSRGFHLRLPYHANPHEFCESNRLTVLRPWLGPRIFVGDDVLEQGYPESPGSGGASPYLRRGAPLRLPASDLIVGRGQAESPRPAPGSPSFEKQPCGSGTICGCCSIFANLLLTVNPGPDLLTLLSNLKLLRDSHHDQNWN